MLCQQLQRWSRSCSGVKQPHWEESEQGWRQVGAENIGTKPASTSRLYKACSLFVLSIWKSSNTSSCCLLSPHGSECRTPKGSHCFASSTSGIIEYQEKLWWHLSAVPCSGCSSRDSRALEVAHGWDTYLSDGTWAVWQWLWQRKRQHSYRQLAEMESKMVAADYWRVDGILFAGEWGCGVELQWGGMEKTGKCPGPRMLTRCLCPEPPNSHNSLKVKRSFHQ